MVAELYMQMFRCIEIHRLTHFREGWIRHFRPATRPT